MIDKILYRLEYAWTYLRLWNRTHITKGYLSRDLKLGLLDSKYNRMYILKELEGGDFKMVKSKHWGKRKRK